MVRILCLTMQSRRIRVATFCFPNSTKAGLGRRIENKLMKQRGATGSSKREKCRDNMYHRICFSWI